MFWKSYLCTAQDFFKKVLVSSVDNQMLIIPACLQSGTVNASAKEKIHVYLLLIHSFIWASRSQFKFQNKASVGFKTCPLAKAAVETVSCCFLPLAGLQGGVSPRAL